MNAEILSTELTLLLNINAIALCIMILISNSISVYFGIKCITCRDMRCDWVFISNAIISLGWIIVFSYILIRCFSHNPLLDHASFEVVIIRPLIMLSSTATAITQEIRYKRLKVYGGAKCGKTSKE